MSDEPNQTIVDFALHNLQSDGVIDRALMCQAIAALRADNARLTAELAIQDEANDILTKHLKEAQDDVSALRVKLAEANARGEALMEAGRAVLGYSMPPEGEEFPDFISVFQGTPGALAAWMARK